MYTYLLIDLGAFVIPFVFSFHKRLKFYKHFFSLFIACFIVAVPFIIWDVIFTEYGIWSFNSDYLIGLEFFGLPLEEYLFFICIPFACVFTYYTLELLPIREIFFSKLFSILLAVFLMILACVYFERLYTSVTFSALSLFLIISCNWNKLTRFYRSFIVLLIPFCIVNGVLTGSFIDEEVVWYNDNFNLNLRLYTIPVEDIFYSMLMQLPTIIIFEKLRSFRSM